MRCRHPDRTAGTTGLRQTDHPEPRRSRDDTLTGNGRLTRDVQQRTTSSGRTVATIPVASDRRDRQAPALFVDLVVWERQAEAAAEHLVKGQAVSFSGRFEPREYTTSNGEKRLALEAHDAAIEYGPNPRGAEPDTAAAVAGRRQSAQDDDIPF